MLQKKLLLLPLLVTGVLVTVSAAIESTLGLSALVHSLAVLEEAAVEEGDSKWEAVFFKRANLRFL